MSAIGTKRTSDCPLAMSAFGGKADIAQTSENVRSLIMSDKIRRLSITAGRRLNFLIMVRPLRS
jgi:hypothetical protein